MSQDSPCGERYVIPFLDLEECVEGANVVTINTNITAVRRGKQQVLRPDVVMERGLELPTINKKILAKKSSSRRGLCYTMLFSEWHLQSARVLQDLQ